MEIGILFSMFSSFVSTSRKEIIDDKEKESIDEDGKIIVGECESMLC